jgi:hypothetical protein
VKLSPEMTAKVEAMAEITASGTVSLPPSLTLLVSIDCSAVVKSEANTRCHWAARQRRFKDQRAKLRREMAGVMGAFIAVKNLLVGGRRASVSFTKLGGRAVDSDNLAGAFKGLRDEVAEWLGLDDASPLVAWSYDQSPGGRQGVRLRVVVTEGI